MAAGCGSPGSPPADDGLAAAADGLESEVAGALEAAASAVATADGWTAGLAGAGVAAELQPEPVAPSMAIPPIRTTR